MFLMEATPCRRERDAAADRGSHARRAKKTGQQSRVAVVALAGRGNVISINSYGLWWSDSMSLSSRS